MTVGEVRDGGNVRGDAVRWTLKLPVFALRDGTRVPMRPCHSAGSRFWQAMEAIRKFLGDGTRDDFPVGWIFDSY